MRPTYSLLSAAIAAAELILFFGAVPCVSNSCLNKDGACTDSYTPSSFTKTCFPKYISDSYYQRHDNLVDSDFEAFINHELDLASSPALMRVSKLQRDLIGEGSHRRLLSLISFRIEPESINILSTSPCEVIIIERLPSGVFADPFELEHLIDRGVFKDAAVFGDTNLELPSFMSNRSVVEIHLHTTNFTGQENAMEMKIQIPVHARYQPLQESGYTRVGFGAPDLFLRCSNGETCSLTSIASNANVESGSTEWSIPCGTKAHGLVVCALTFCSALVAAALIITASLHKSDLRLCQRTKQS